MGEDGPDCQGPVPTIRPIRFPSGRSEWTVSLFDGPPVAPPVMRPSVVALVAAAVLLVAAVPAAAGFGMPEPLTERGKIVEDIYVQITIAGILVFILVFALLVWVLVRYREGSGHG